MRTIPFLFLLIAGCAHPQALAEKPEPLLAVSASDAEEIFKLERQTAWRDVTREQLLDVEWQLASALEHAGLLDLAFIYAMPLARGAAHPHRVDALELLVRIQEPRQDDVLIPSVLEQIFSEPNPPVLSAPAMARVAWLRARIAFRRGQLEQVVSLCTQVPPGSPVFARAEYLRAIALADPRLDGGRGQGEAIATLEHLLANLDAHQEGAERVGGQALLALGRLTYSQRRWREAVDWYEKAAKLPPVRARALFEQSLALIQQREWARALSTLRSDEVRHSGISEVAITEAIASHFSGDAAAAEQAIARAEQPRAPNAVDWKTAEPALAAEAWRSGRGVTPQTLALVHENRKIERLFASIESFENERRAVEQLARWKGTATGESFTLYLNQNLGTLQQVLGAYSLSEFKEQQIRSAVDADTATILGIQVALTRHDIDGAIARAERVLSLMPEKGPPTSEALFWLMALRQARAEALKGPEADEERAEVTRLQERILAGDPTFVRFEEAKHFLDARP